MFNFPSFFFMKNHVVSLEEQELNNKIQCIKNNIGGNKYITRKQYKLCVYITVKYVSTPISGLSSHFHTFQDMFIFPFFFLTFHIQLVVWVSFFFFTLHY